MKTVNFVFIYVSTGITGGCTRPADNLFVLGAAGIRVLLGPMYYLYQTAQRLVGDKKNESDN
jgi:hypothetical protein